MQNSEIILTIFTMVAAIFGFFLLGIEVGKRK